MSTYKVETISVSPKTKLGEAPHWNIYTQSLYYIDAQAPCGTIHRYDYAENKVYTATIESTEPYSFVIPLKEQPNQYAVGLERTVTIIEWDGVSETAKILRTAFEVDQSDNLKDNKFNDAKSDPTGRFYGGTLTNVKSPDEMFKHKNGTLYKYKKGEEVKGIRSEIGLSNGLAWNIREKKFYYIDTAPASIFEYDWDPKTGDIYNEKTLISFKGEGESYGLPDGMTIDSDGNLYVAFFFGAKVLKLNGKTGKVDLEIKFPATQITSVAFGGPDLDELFVTSASNATFGPIGSDAGSLFRVTGLGVIALPMNEVDL